MTSSSRTAIEFVWSNGRFYSASQDDSPGGAKEEHSYNGVIAYRGKAKQFLRMGASNEDLGVFAQIYLENAGFLYAHGPADVISKGPQSLILAKVEASANADVKVEPNGPDGAFIVHTIQPNDLSTTAKNTNLIQMETVLRKANTSDDEIQRRLSTIRRLRELPSQLTVTYVLQPDMNYAVLRSERRLPDNTLVNEVRNGDFVKLDGRAVWLPRKSMYRSFTPGENGTNPALEIRYQVTGISTKSPPDDQFTLNYSTPGTIVTDVTNPVAIEEHTIRPVHELLPQAGAQPGRVQHAPPIANTSWLWWIVPPILGVLAVVVAYGVVTSRKGNSFK